MRQRSRGCDRQQLEERALEEAGLQKQIDRDAIAEFIEGFQTPPQRHSHLVSVSHEAVEAPGSTRRSAHELLGSPKTLPLGNRPF